MKDYIRELRALVGSRPLILPGTSVVVVNDQGRILLVERSDTADWGLPGGFMEPGESFEEAGRREVFEETGLEIEAMELHGVFSGAEYYFRYPHGDEVFNVTAAYVARHCAGSTLSLDAGEVSRAGFFELTALPAKILPPERPIIDSYARSMVGERDGTD